MSAPTKVPDPFPESIRWCGLTLKDEEPGRGYYRTDDYRVVLHQRPSHRGWRWLLEVRLARGAMLTIVAKSPAAALSEGRKAIKDVADSVEWLLAGKKRRAELEAE